MESPDHHFDRILTYKKIDEEKVEERQQPRREKPSHYRQNYQKIAFLTKMQSVKMITRKI